MNQKFRNKKKILNDPVYGFISIFSDLTFDLIEHRYFQRLRRIKQLGLTHLVYPGALHTRFHHAIGAMHLMEQAIGQLRSKDHEITRDEAAGTLTAILLHDIGHGPYSHSLEKSIVCSSDHEALSIIFMNRLAESFGDVLKTGIEIFKNDYPKKFLHQLVSSQLDMDRLDYLKRDSFFTGVSEGVINTDRIIKMLDVVDDNLVVEAKGIYSIEKFIIARRLMYWQVYLHKTVIAAEQMLVKIMNRAKFLCRQGEKIFTTSALKLFLENEICYDDFENDPEILEFFSRIDDYDIFTCIKEWAWSDDKILSALCSSMVNRQLFRTEIKPEAIPQNAVEAVKEAITTQMGISISEAGYFVITGRARNSAYDPANDKINISYRDGSLIDISEASDQLNIDVLSKIVTKYFICFPKQYSDVFNEEKR